MSTENEKFNADTRLLLDSSFKAIDKIHTEVEKISKVLENGNNEKAALEEAREKLLDTSSYLLDQVKTVLNRNGIPIE